MEHKKTVGSFAGGGAYGIGPCSWLVRLAASLQRLGYQSLQEFFALFTGTSVGAILAALLACGFSPGQALALFTQHLKGIFGSTRWQFRILKKGAKYHDSYVTKLLQTTFGDRTMSQTDVPLFVTAWDFRRKDLKVFGPTDTLVPIWYAVRCSMSATTFFAPMPGYRVVDGVFVLESSCRYGDGGFGANDPALVGFDAGLGAGLLDMQDLRVLEIVTTGLNPERKPVDPNAFILEELKDQVLPAVTSGNSSMTNHHLVSWITSLGGSKESVFRVRPPCPDNDMDDLRIVEPVRRLWESQFDADECAVVQFFTDTMPKDDMGPEVQA